ncbi:MAG: glycosyltransferase family 4 protein [Nitrospira sp.]|nr:glycosyltransferase family 4 protein [Nitrospira sp.]MDH4244007.1 glycosyltransferase family 4 protein [Nitrospira sp.]MDH4355879.1 glycosyltransferase family 4 protein [Nitrospira sp.]MDH5317906.1 glycosyltransferase family 4 protein [Nitrospira sp.]
MRAPIICHICDYGSEYGGAFIESLLFLSRYCRDKLQIATFCVFPDRARNRSWLSKLDEEGVGYGFIPHKRNVVGQVRSLLSDREPLVLHSHFYFFDLTTVLLKFVAFKNAGIVWHYHSRSGRSVKQRIKDALKIRLLFNLLGDHCIAVGDGVFRDITDAGLAPGKSILIYNGVNTDRFLNKHEIYLEVRKDLGISREDLVFMLLGWSPLVKGVDVFCRAAEEIGRKYKHCKFLVVGRDRTREFVSHLSCVSKLGESLRVIDPVEDFSILVKGVDIFVSASRSEGFGYAVIEAMATEKLILCSDIVPVRQTYGRSKGVWLYPSENWKMLANLMEQSVGLSSDEKQFLGLTNREHVIENYSIDQWSEKVGLLYKQMIARRK